MIDKKFPNLRKLQEKNLWFIHTYKDGNSSIFKSNLSETDDHFFRIRINIADGKPWFHLTPHSPKKDIRGSTVFIEDIKGDIIPDILTKETIEAGITKNTIIFYENNIQEIIDFDYTIEEYCKNHSEYTFGFI